MNIVFWGARSHCGTTANMLAIAGMLEILYPKFVIAVDNGAGKVQWCGEVDGIESGTTVIRLKDAGCGMGVRTRRALMQADMIVVNISRDRESIEGFFENYLGMGRNSFVLLSSFPREGTGKKSDLELIYRIESDSCGLMETSAAYYVAASRGRSREFVKREYTSPSSLRNEQFIQELQLLAERIVRRAERNISER